MKTGASASRAFHHSARLPCGSVSIKATGPAPTRSACTARWPHSVVLPEPPFCAEQTMTCMPGNCTAETGVGDWAATLADALDDSPPSSGRSALGPPERAADVALLANV